MNGFASFATVCNTDYLVKFPVIVVVYVATSLVNKDEYVIYYAYTSLQSVIYL